LQFTADLNAHYACKLSLTNFQFLKNKCQNTSKGPNFLTHAVYYLGHIKPLYIAAAAAADEKMN